MFGLSVLPEVCNECVPGSAWGGVYYHMIFHICSEVTFSALHETLEEGTHMYTVHVFYKL